MGDSEEARYVTRGSWSPTQSKRSSELRACEHGHLRPFSAVRKFKMKMLGLPVTMAGLL
jgi:hypothetical protein